MPESLIGPLLWPAPQVTLLNVELAHSLTLWFVPLTQFHVTVSPGEMKSLWIIELVLQFVTPSALQYFVFPTQTLAPPASTSPPPNESAASATATQASAARAPRARALGFVGMAHPLYDAPVPGGLRRARPQAR